MADGAATEDFSSLPLNDRVEHKVPRCRRCPRQGVVRRSLYQAFHLCRSLTQVWKARVSAYEELAKLFRTLPSADDPEYRKWIGYLKKMVTDSNAAAQDAGIVALLSFLQNADIGGQYGDTIACDAAHAAGRFC